MSYRLDRERMGERIAELRGAFDCVLIDSPSLNAYGQASGQPSDGLVFPWRQTPRGGRLVLRLAEGPEAAGFLRCEGC
jgi:hypothetical protein